MEFILKDICNMQSGGTPKSTNHLFYGGNIPWVTISDFKNSEGDIIYKTEQTITENGLAAINGRFFKKNTLLLAMYGSVGKTAMLGVDASTNQAILGISPKDESVLNIKFLKYWLDYNKDFLYSQGKGATLHNISLTVVQRQKINLPDLETQNKIVAILDKAKAILDKREETIKKYDELLRATFLEMFGDPFFNTKKFPTDTLENHCSFITKGTTPKSIKIFDKPFEGSIPFLKVYHITNGEIDFHYKPSYVSDSVHNKELSRSKVKPNDVLMNIVGPPLGKIGIVPDTYEEWNINQAVVIFRAEGELLPIYLLNTLMNKNLLKSIVEQAVGVRQLNLSLKQCREITIPIPPIAMQKEFERTYIVQKRLKEGFIKSKHKLEQLIKSISKSAFDGSMDFNTAVDLEVLLENDYDFFKKNSNSSSIKLLLERLNTDELNEYRFNEQRIYDKAKSFVFELIKEGKVQQVFDEKTKKVKLTV